MKMIGRVELKSKDKAEETNEDALLLQVKFEGEEARDTCFLIKANPLPALIWQR